MIEEINEAIRKNLPAKVADELKGYLQECEELRKGNGFLEKRVADLSVKLNELSSYRDASKMLKTDRENLNTERQKFEIEKREFQIKCLEEKYVDLRTLTRDAFRNPELSFVRLDDTNKYDSSTGHNKNENKRISTDYSNDNYP